MHSLLQPNLASPTEPSMSIPYPPAFASSGIIQSNNVRLAPSFAFSGASSDPSQACARGFTLCPGWRLSSGSHRPIAPSTLLANYFRLAPAVFFSSLPATRSDALLGHQLKRQYVGSICGSKCKNQINLWISPEVVHCCSFSAGLGMPSLEGDGMQACTGEPATRAQHPWPAPVGCREGPDGYAPHSQ